MWTVASQCKWCGEAISEDRRAAGVSACSCGWVDNSQFPEQWDRAISKSIAKFGVVAVAALIPVILFFAHWSGFGAEVLGIKLKSTMGAASATDYIRMGEICEMLSKNNCAVDSYTRVIRSYPKEKEGYIKLARIYLEANDPAGAVQVYQAFFISGGQDNNLKFRMANLLAESGQYEMAAQTYQQLMDSDPGILHITVAKAYVQMLIRMGQFQSAKDVLSRFHGLGDNAKEYLTDELTQIDAGLKQSSSATNRKKI